MKNSAVADFFGGFKKFDPNDPQFDRIGSWPAVVKLVLLIILAGAILGLTAWFKVKDQREQLAQLQMTEQNLRNEYQRKAGQAANLEAYRQQLAQVRVTFEQVLSQLPTDNDIANMLDNVNFLATQSGLELIQGEWGAEVVQPLFIEQPINIVVSGGYHQLGNYVSAITALPRIVTLHDFTVTRINTGAGGNNPLGVPVSSPLRMTVQARTYRYRDPEN